MFSGIYQGLWYMHSQINDEIADAAAASALTGTTAIWAGVARQVIGMVVLVAMLEGLKKLVVYVVATLIGLDPKDPTCKQHLAVELSYKYIGYFTPSFCASYYMPLFFQWMGIHRRHYFQEIMTYTHQFGL